MVAAFIRAKKIAGECWTFKKLNVLILGKDETMQYRENGHVYSANREHLECDECGATFQFGDIAASMDRCPSAPNRFDNDGCFVIDTDTGQIFGIADTPKTAEREAENESLNRLMAGDWGIADEELSEQ